MRVFGTISSVIMVLLVLAVSVTLCWLAFDKDRLELVVALAFNNATLGSGRAALGITGGILCLLSLMTLMRLLGLSEPGAMKRSIVFASSLGEVRVAVDTIERYLSRVGLDIPDVQKLIPQIQSVDDGNRIAVDVTVHVTLGRNVREVSEQIAEHIATQLKNMLGVTEVGNINVNVREVQPSELGHS